MAEPAKLELLTRRPGEPGFEVHEVESHQAYLGFRPERPPSTEWELTPQPRGVDGSRHYILKSHKRDNYLLLGPQEYFLWNISTDAIRSMKSAEPCTSNSVLSTLRSSGSFGETLSRRTAQ
jgi:hypothetical protein